MKTDFMHLSRVIWTNTILQAFLLILALGVGVLYLFEPGGATYYALYLMFFIGVLQFLMAIVLWFARSPNLKFLRIYFIAVLVYFLVLSIGLRIDSQESEPLWWVRWMFFPTPYIFTFAFWYYSLQLLRFRKQGQ